MGANGYAIRADRIALDSANGAFELYQLGRQPYVPCHGTQLYMVLDTFARSITKGLWKVGADGFDEPDTIFRMLIPRRGVNTIICMCDLYMVAIGD